MIDYLSGIASQVINPPRAVSPVLRTPFDVPPPETTDLPFAETAFPDAIHQDTSPADRSEVHSLQPTEATKTGAVDNPITRLAPEPSTARRGQRNAASAEQPDVPDTPVEPGTPNERQSPPPQFSQQSPLLNCQQDSPIQPLPPVDTDRPEPNEPRTRADERQKETVVPQDIPHRSENRQEPPSDTRVETEVNLLMIDSKDEVTPRHAAVERSVLDTPRAMPERTIPESAMPSVGELHPQLQIPEVRQKSSRQDSQRTREIVPLSAIPALPPQLLATAPLPRQPVAALTDSFAESPPMNETVVHVNIGRVVVRANVSQQKPVAAREPSSRQAAQSLEEYLRGGPDGRSA